MVTLKGDAIFLRALEPEDVDYMYLLENDEHLWKVSHTLAPFSKALLSDYIANSHRDIYEVKQLRLVICDKDNGNPVGLVDLFDFDPKNQRVAIGITVYPAEARRKGYATEAVKMVSEFCFHHLNVHQVYAGVTQGNEDSAQLFEKAGFLQTGIKKAWTLQGSVFKDELIFQLFRN